MYLHHLYSQAKYSEIISLDNSQKYNFSSSPHDSQILAAAYFRIGEFNKSLEILRTLESSLSGQPDYLSLYAAASRRLGFLNEALVLFEKALALDPSNNQIKNNYSNLLIDLRRFDDAKRILDQIITEMPDYQDALTNRNRLSQLQSSELPAKSTASNFELDDPLFLAFSQDEVDYSNTRYFPKGRAKHQSGVVDLPSMPSKAVYDDYLNAARKALLENNYALAHKFCSQALSVNGPSVEIYDCVADIYFNQKNYLQAEIYTLNSIAIGSRSLKSFFNMATFASMKRDFKLATHYVDIAASIDQSAPQIKAQRELISQQMKANSAPFSFGHD